MEFLGINNEQEEAIRYRSPQLTISAGAGAGKTRVLVERYLRHVMDDGVDPDQILSITYTRKAAAEMKLRVVRRLREAGLLSASRIAQTGPISTIHGFCERTLREYPFVAGVDPDFEILSVTQSNELLKKAAAYAIENADNEMELEFIRNEATIWRYGADRSAASSISDTVIRMIDQLRTAGHDVSELEAVIDSQESVLNYWRNFLLNTFSRQFDVHIENDKEKDVDEIYRSFIEALPDCDWIGKAINMNEEQDCLNLTCGLISLVVRAWRWLENEFKKGLFVDFSQLEIATRKMLRGNPDVFRGRYRYLLADEAQDINPVQHDILRSIPVESRLFVGDAQQSIYSFRGAVRELFVEESNRSDTIYLKDNWRSSGRILNAINLIFQKRWGDTYQAMNSKRNGSLEDTEDVFASPLSWGDPVEIWRVPKNKAENAISKGVLQLIDEGVRPGDITVLVHRGTRLDDYLLPLAEHGVPYSATIGKHYFIRNEVRDISNLLLAVCNPLDDLALLSALRSPLVGLSIDSIFRIAMHESRRSENIWGVIQHSDVDLPADDRSKLSEFLSWFEPLSKVADRFAPWEVLTAIYQSVHIDARLVCAPNSSQLIANSRKLLSFAMERRGMETRSFAEWLSNMQKIRSDDGDAESLSPDADAVRFLTLHSAKGLEWNCVVLDAKITSYDSPERSFIHSKSGIIACQRSERYAPLVVRLVSKLRKLAEEGEKDRLLYVGMTRAIDRLCIAVREGDSRDTYGRVIVESLAPQWRPSEGVLVRDLTMLLSSEGQSSTPEPQGST